MTDWKRVVFAVDCDEDGNCPACHEDFADCDCPGPTQDDEYEYDEDAATGALMARRLPVPHDQELDSDD